MTTLNSLLNTERKLREGYNLDHDKYWKDREVFVKDLGDYIRNTDFSSFSGKKVLQICSLVSSYRPMEPFSFLLRCSQLVSH